MTEIFPDDDPYLDQDTVFGVRDDLVMVYHEKPPSAFPAGMALSGSVDEPFLAVNFDVILSKDEPRIGAVAVCSVTSTRSGIKQQYEIDRRPW